jgi:membrane protein
MLVSFCATIYGLEKGAGMQFERVKLFSLVKAAGLKWYEDNCIRLGASLSYYTIFSLFPLILVVLTIIRLLLDNSEDARNAILDALASVTGGFRTDFETALRAASQTRIASSIFGIVALLVGASWVFGELVSAFNIIWRVEAPASGGPMHFLRTTFFSFALVLSVAFLLLVSMIISAVLAAINQMLTTLHGGFILWQILHVSINLGVLTGIFALLFKFLPQTHVEWHDVWLGAFLIAALWTVLQVAISHYITFSSYENYGPVGAVLALVVWVYLSSQVVFFGGELTSVYARWYGSRALESNVAALPQVPAAASPEHAFPARSVGKGQKAEENVELDPFPAGSHERLKSGITGILLGIIGTVGITVAAVCLSIWRAVRRLRIG